MKLNNGYASYINVNRLKCIDRGGDFSSNGSLSTNQAMSSLINAIPDIQVPSGTTFDFTQAQYDLLTEQQKTYVLGLGYAITIKV